MLGRRPNESKKFSASIANVDGKVFFGIGGAALDWLQSYLTSRQGCVRRGSARSTHKTVLFGVPQGSVLGPLLFIIYTAGLIDLIEGSGLNPHLYADDTQIQGSCRFGSANQLQSTLSVCLDEVSDWMRSNRLQLNTAKAEILWCSTTRRQYHLPSAAVRVRENYVLPSTTVHDLGVLSDSNVRVRRMYGIFRCSLRQMPSASCSGLRTKSYGGSGMNITLCKEPSLPLQFTFVNKHASGR